jgi:hypothetical protein
MRFQRHNEPKDFAPRAHFSACKARRPLLCKEAETAIAPCPGGRILLSPACSSVDQKRQTPQAGDFFPGLVEGSRHPIHCGSDGSDPQDAVFDEMNERTTAAGFGKKLCFSAPFCAFSHFAPRFFEGKPRRKKQKQTSKLLQKA